MDKHTKRYVNRARGVSSDGVPNRKGGSWPNHPSMRYELPIPFSPGADQVNDVYREKYVETFGPQADISARFCSKCDKTWSWCSCTGDDKRAPVGQVMKQPLIVKCEEPLSDEVREAIHYHPCSACGEEAPHWIAPGRYACEEDPS